MKLLYFDDYRLGVLSGDNVVDVTDIVSALPHLQRQDLMRALIEHWDEYRGRLEEVVAKGGGTPLSSVRIRPPLPKPTNVLCMAVNYMENGTRKEPAPINAFAKPRSAIAGTGDTMVLYDIPATIFEGEAELALVIGKQATNVPQAEAMDYIFGYVNFIDGSARDVPPPGSFFMVKTYNGYAPIGPFLVTADEVDDPQKLSVKLWNNGVLMQDFNTDDMANKIPRCIEFLSAIQTLEPGDIVATGTNHRGLNPFMDGDRVELECEGLGRLAITIRDDLKRTWARETRLQREEQGLKGTTPQLTGKYAK